MKVLQTTMQVVVDSTFSDRKDVRMQLLQTTLQVVVAFNFSFICESFSASSHCGRSLRVVEAVCREGGLHLCVQR